MDDIPVSCDFRRNSEMNMSLFLIAVFNVVMILLNLSERVDRVTEIESRMTCVLATRSGGLQHLPCTMTLFRPFDFVHRNIGAPFKHF